MRIAAAGLVAVAACSVPPFSGPLDAGSTHDEDMDGVPDDLDPCPHIPGPAATHDSDGDGIGDPCDPQPDDTMTRDIKRFYSFAAGTDDLYVDGAVTQADDAIDVGAVGDISSFVWVPTMLTDVRVEIGFEVKQFGTNIYQELVVRTGHTPSTTPGARNSESCDIAYADNSTSTLEVGDSIDVGQQSSTFQVGYPKLSGHLQVTQVNGGYRCTVDQLPNSIIGPSLMLVPPLKFTLGQVGFSTHDAVVRLRYIFLAGR